MVSAQRTETRVAEKKKPRIAAGLGYDFT